MPKVIVRPGQIAFFGNMRWREGEEIEIPESYCPDKKLPAWAAPVSERASIRKQIDERGKERRGQGTEFAPGSLARQREAALPE